MLQLSVFLFTGTQFRHNLRLIAFASTHARFILDSHSSSPINWRDEKFSRESDGIKGGDLPCVIFRAARGKSGKPHIVLHSIIHYADRCQTDGGGRSPYAVMPLVCPLVNSCCGVVGSVVAASMGALVRGKRIGYIKVFRYKGRRSKTGYHPQGVPRFASDGMPTTYLEAKNSTGIGARYSALYGTKPCHLTCRRRLACCTMISTIGEPNSHYNENKS